MSYYHRSEPEGFTDGKLLIGVDLGSVNDYTCIVPIERYGEVTTPPYWLKPQWKFREWRVRDVHRWVGEPYTVTVERIKSIAASLGHPEVVVDATGVGRPVVDFLHQAGVQRVKSIVITGGEAVTKTPFVEEYRVPKVDLVSTLQVAVEKGHLRIPESLELREELVAEFGNFTAKRNEETGSTTYEHWRSRDHDDMVLAIACALWWETHRPFYSAGAMLDI